MKARESADEIDGDDAEGSQESIVNKPQHDFQRYEEHSSQQEQ